MSSKPKLPEFCAELVALHRQARQLGLNRSADLIESALFATLDKAAPQDGEVGTEGAAESRSCGAASSLH